MTYKRFTTMDILEILRRVNQGQSIKCISRSLDYDRKTIRKYIQAIRLNPNENPANVIKEINPHSRINPWEQL